jgi:hypothetical protein
MVVAASSPSITLGAEISWRVPSPQSAPGKPRPLGQSLECGPQTAIEVMV